MDALLCLFGRKRCFMGVKFRTIGYRMFGPGEPLTMTNNMPPKGVQVMAVVLIGVLVFAAMGGAHVVSPTHIGWLMTGGDTPAHYLGWSYFRHTSWWQWPLGANPEYGSDAPGTIVMSDSIPVAAFFFKLWRGWLSLDFQYFGIWVLFCFVMQAWFGYRLMERLSEDVWLRLFGCFFFTTAAIFLVRIYMHPALSAQWILLAAIYLGLDKHLRTTAWWALLLFAALVHAYLLVMTSALWLACLFHHVRIRSMRLPAMLGYVLAVMFSIVLAMWSAGYFVHEAVVPLNVRSYTNLAFPIWSGFCVGDPWSHIIPCSKFESLGIALQLGDGFGYFGLGYLVLSVIALVFLALGKRMSPGWSGAVRPMLLVSLMLLIYAMGDRVYVGPHLLFAFHWPDPLDYAAHVFRGAGRMIWPLWYLCLFMVMAAVISGFDTQYARVVLLVAFILQCADLSTVAMKLQRELKQRTVGIPRLGSPQWILLDKQYRHFVFIKPRTLPNILVGWSQDYRMLTLQAARDGLSVNIGYLSRMNETVLDAALAKRTALLLGGGAEPSTYYVIDDSDLWQKILCAPDHGQWHGMLNNMPLLVPDPSPDLKLPPASVGQACSG
ncbi:hypothetical protein EO087_03960 [Dyella sp. M7H15-1]|uniref:DUF6311 domain-containing protein n=1 Tax=Dyella sp. M7H15-1 TaxID=2501295 RepID=UPI001004E080|nr:DUF6311 domain-containing protein [Dyella sp. M7H15-1]QAU23246.1 hypothetical protein EO087_03960 [Dyella sp. M7H15-1]